MKLVISEKILIHFMTCFSEALSLASEVNVNEAVPGTCRIEMSVKCTC